MKTLYLLRHAKAEPARPGLDDHERALTDRGLHDATATGKVLAGLAPQPDFALCSTATRTRQTWERVVATLDVAPTVSFTDRLYLASPAVLLDAVREIPRSIGALLLVGHNEGLHDFARVLAGEGDLPDLLRLIGKFPTAALAGLAFEVDDWRLVDVKQGRLVHVSTPKDPV